MVERIEGISTFKQREYIIAENNAYDELRSNGYIPQGRDKGFKTVCVMKVEHPEFWEHPIKCGKREFYHFKNWQEALEELVIKSQ